MRQVIQYKNGESIVMEEAAHDAECWAHELPTKGLGRALVTKMRERHGNGGVDVCVECVSRAKQDVRP